MELVIRILHSINLIWITDTAEELLKVIYYAFFFYLAMSYGFIFWGNSSHNSLIFRIQIKAIGIMEGCWNRVLCRNLFKKVQILS
jgi:hypothetical protein